MADHNEHEDHGDAIYWKTFAGLVAMTAVEVFMYFESVHQLSDNAIRIILVLLMVTKFFFVGAVFMHLKDDNNIFTQMFTAGLIIAYPVYMAAAFSFGVFSSWDWIWKVVLIVVPTVLVSAWLLGTSRKPGEDRVDQGPLTPLGH